MLIKDISASKDGSNITLSANFAFEGEKYRQVFFRVEKKYKDFLVSDASPFLTIFLMPCMKRGEDIIVEGTAPSGFRHSLAKIMNVVKGWNVGFKKVNVKIDYVLEDKKKPDAIGCFFSGGVDSFYTYLKHKKSITHLIHIKSWEVPPEISAHANIIDNNQILAEKEKVNFIKVESNYKQILEPVLDWEWNMGANMAAVGLMLRNGFKKVYIPSTMRRDQICPYGTHPDLDPLWSTKYLKIYHDGCEYSRLEKVLYSISKSPLALKNLHTCTHGLKGQYNCNKCFKCVQTKIELLCADVLQKASTFDRILSPVQVKNVFYKYNLNLNIFGEESLEYLKKNNKHKKIQIALEEGLRKSKNPSFLRKIVNYFTMLDKKYNHRRIYMSIFKLKPNQDRNIFFKMFANWGFIR